MVVFVVVSNSCFLSLEGCFIFTVMVVFVVVSNSSFLSLEGFVNGTEGMEDVDPVEQNLRQAIEEEKAK